MIGKAPKVVKESPPAVQNDGNFCDDIDASTLPHVTPNGIRNLLSMDHKGGVDEHRLAEDWSFALLDGIDGVEGSLNELERKVKAATKAKCGNEDEPPTERFGRVKFLLIWMTRCGNISTKTFRPQGGNAKDWSGKYSKRSYSAHTVTGHMILSKWPSVGGD